MTTPAARPPAAPGDRAEAIERIRAHGGRMTAAKRTVLDVVFGSGPPRTAEQIADAAAGVDRSVVYRCLRQFEELGIASHVHLGHGQAVYRRRDLDSVPVACAACGAVTELDRDAVRDLERLVADETGIELDLVHFPLTGRCGNCRTSD
ncbi:MAG TPA: transcriptional repressor [Acidimicrobiales bacterium]|nr:transcriptional repressor [Acidimicrobiales bacterium]